MVSIDADPNDANTCNYSPPQVMLAYGNVSISIFYPQGEDADLVAWAAAAKAEVDAASR